jgi:chromosome partitioning protein
MITIAIINQKGGVAKTTTAVNLGAHLAQQGYKTLLVDLDMQSNLTLALNVENPEKTIYDFFHKEKTVPTPVGKNLDLLPSTIDFAGIELEIVNELQREMLLHKALVQVQENYQYCIMDCPPALNMITINALSAANCIIIPIEASLYAIKGLNMMIENVSRVRENINPKLFILGILITKYTERAIVSRRLFDRLEEMELTQYLFETKIRYSADLKKAEDRQQTVYDFSRSSLAAGDYRSLTKEIINRLNKKHHDHE